MGLREANQNFSKAIKAIKAGKAIVLTERGKPIATITPIVDERSRYAMRVFLLVAKRAGWCAHGRSRRRVVFRPPLCCGGKGMKIDAGCSAGIL